MNIENLRRERIDLMNQRSTHLDAAAQALAANDQAAYDAAMASAQALNARIDQISNTLAEFDRFGPAAPAGGSQEPTNAEAVRFVEQLGTRNGAQIPAQQVINAFRKPTNAVTEQTGFLATPTGAGNNGPQGFNAVVSSILEQVTVLDLTGLSGYEEAYEVSDMEAQGGRENIGKASDPVLAVAEINPYDASVTTFVDRGLEDLTPVKYQDIVFNMAVRALRRKAARLIMSGSGGNSPKMHGITTAKNKDGQEIFQTLEATKVDASLLDNILMAYGGTDALGSNARLYLAKADLAAIKNLRGTNEQKTLYTIRFDPADPTSGWIREDGSDLMPFTIVPGATALSTATAGDAPIKTMVYGDPANYALGLFGDYRVRVDGSYKAGERQNTILGDVKIGGNLVVHNGFVVVTLPAAAGE